MGNSRKPFQLVQSEDDGQQAVQLWQPHYRSRDRYVIMNLLGYGLSFGIPLVQFGSGDDGRHQTTVHLGTSVLPTVDGGVKPNVALHRFAELNVVISSVGTLLTKEEFIPWQIVDIDLPWFFLSMAVDAGTTSQDYILTGNLEYKEKIVSESEFAALCLNWGIMFKDKRDLEPTLRQTQFQQGGSNPPYFVVGGTEEL